MTSDTQRSQGVPTGGAFGPNAWLVDDMYEQYRADPSSVSESWREFFTDYVPPGAAPEARETTVAQTPAQQVSPEAAQPPTRAATVPGVSSEQLEALSTAADGSEPVVSGAVATSAVVASSAPVEEVVADETPEPLRGAAARIASNMETSLSVPTATSVRTVPAKLLEVNRSAINRHLASTTGTKVSFTHLIGFAVVRSLQAVPVLNSSFVPDVDGKGTPGVVHHPHVGLGLAVDVSKADGSRTLMVPVVREAENLDFRSFLVAYEDLVRRVHTQKASPDDFGGATVTLTNPGTLGTVQSVPRLLVGQGAIIGVGSLGYPAEYQAADRRSLAALGVGPVVSLTSTYDHRIIQGAESGIFLGQVAERLMGGHGFYEEVFAAMDIPYEPVHWQPDVNALDGEHQRALKQVHVQSLVNMYRVRGHLIADLDPLSAEPRPLHPELDPKTYGLTIWDLDREFVVDGLAGKEVLTLGEALDILRDAYCRTLTIEYMHIQDPKQKRWVQQQVEGASVTLSKDEQRHILDRLNAAEAFERFLHTRYVGQKRYGLEGAESAIVFLDALLDEAAVSGESEAVLGMAHRGRLNVLANIAHKSYGEIFAEFEGNLDPESVQGSGDVKYHKGVVGKFVGRSGKQLVVTLAANPSHLEAVDPVVEGMARAKQEQLPSDRVFGVLPVLIHGDAAFAGQGVVAETLELSQLFGYATGGTVHLVINNQLGFTTAPQSARSSFYPTDVGKVVQAPIIHVNGDDPEACARAARLAFGFREAFHNDVVIDMVCYRRFGHNEGDDPSYTQPKMYSIIESLRSVRKIYTESLVRRGDITLEEAEEALNGFQARLQAALDETRQSAPPRLHSLPPPPPPVEENVDISTGVPRPVLEQLVRATTKVPVGFTLHPKLARQFDQRDKMVESGQVDWALGESLALGSMLLEGTDVRLAGQDTRRGTFSQRHDVLVDYSTGAEWIPLAHLDSPSSGRFTILDSLLSEYAALGFEYGYSVEAPDSFVAWEAQFGDFANGAQVIIDNFLVAAEDKWGQHSGLVLLLPHGYEGQGPEHSSARIERFLSLSAEGNMRLAQPTTSAQYFHLLRSQVRGPVRRPLVVFTPKYLLRARQSRSRLEDLESGSFDLVLGDPSLTDPSAGSIVPQQVRRVLLCSGKIAFDLAARREQLRSQLSGGAQQAGSATATAPTAAATAQLPAPGIDPSAVSVVRVEQLYPWPERAIGEELARYPQASEVVWVQEEPENMGAWSFAHGRLHKLLRDRYTLRHVSRAESASPATGSATIHQLGHEDLLVRAFA
jgi:multifunctional 2-oxoglutarate metabolism enzyme